MPRPTPAQSLGRRGEDRAAEFLRRQGFTILSRRYQTRHGEIDLIAREGDALCFIEVKTRSGDEFGDPAEAITPAKQKRLALAAQSYLAEKKALGAAVRFDVVAVRVDGGRFACELLRGAFSSPFAF